MDKYIYVAMGEDEETGDEHFFRFTSSDEASRFAFEAGKLNPRIEWSCHSIMITDFDTAMSDLKFGLAIGL